MDFIGGLDLAQRIEQEGLLIIPEYLPDLGRLEDDMVQLPKGPSVAFPQVGSDFGFPPSPARYTQQDYFAASIEYPLLFADLTNNPAQPGPLEPVQVIRWRDQRLIPIQRSAGQENQAQSDRPSLEARQALSRAALVAAQPGGGAALLVFGGDLPESAWGAPAAAGATLHYLKSRPWIQLLNLQDLLALVPHLRDSSSVEAVLRKRLSRRNRSKLRDQRRTPTSWLRISRGSTALNVSDRPVSTSFATR